MKELFKQRKEFNKAFEIEGRKTFGIISEKDYCLELLMLNEEVHEYIEACDNNDPIEIADAIADTLYLIIGTAVKHGLKEEQLSRIMTEVHRSNMSKLHEGEVVKNSNGKVIKSSTFSPPDIKGCL